jgi:translation initiation factor 3 subunit A
LRISHVLELVAPLNQNQALAPAGEGTETAPPSAPPTRFYDQERIEAFIMACARRRELNVRINHAEGTIIFTDEGLTPKSANPSEALSEPLPGMFVPEVPLRSRMSTLASTLHNCLTILYPPPPTEEQLQSLISAAQLERKALAVRRAVVARRREMLSELMARKEKELASREYERSRKVKEEEEKKVAEDRRSKEQKIQQQLRTDIDKAETRKIVEAWNSSTRGPKLELDVSSVRFSFFSSSEMFSLQKVEQMTPEEVLKFRLDQLDKEKRELNERLRITSKRVDHMERAFRREEQPLLTVDYEAQQKEDRAAYEVRTKSHLEATLQKHEEDVTTKGRLARMMDDYNQKRGVITGRRGEEYAKKKEDAKRKMEEEKTKRKKEILKAREEERKRKEEEERQLREEEEERQREAEGMLVAHIAIVASSIEVFRTRAARASTYCRGSCNSCRSRAQEARRRGENCFSSETKREGARRGCRRCTSQTIKAGGSGETGSRTGGRKSESKIQPVWQCTSSIRWEWRRRLDQAAFSNNTSRHWQQISVACNA